MRPTTPHPETLDTACTAGSTTAAEQNPGHRFATCCRLARSPEASRRPRREQQPSACPRCDDRLNGGFDPDCHRGWQGDDTIVTVGGGIDRIDCGHGRVIKDRADVAVRCERTG
jgi:hypothetical protein